VSEKLPELNPRVKIAIDEAFAFAREGQAGIAAEHILPFVEMFPAEPNLRFCIALFFHRGERFELAVEHAKEAVRLRPTWEQASWLYCSVLMKLGRKVEASDEIRRFLTRKPSQVYSGMLHDALNDWEPDAKLLQ
jgi:predicted Zn-dependent protease